MDVVEKAEKNDLFKSIESKELPPFDLFFNQNKKNIA